MALAGEGAILIWNDIAPEFRAEFYAWHLTEHMPERVGTPGFRRGRRYGAVDPGTAPEFFTLYETDSYEVLVGQDYLARLNAPTAWTRATTAGFRNTERALTRVRLSRGPGPGGVLASLRWTEDAAPGEDVAHAACAAVEGMAQVSGVHLCLADAAASAARTAESRERADILPPPAGAILVEGCNAEPVRLAAEACRARLGTGLLGLYRLEHSRLKTAFAAG